MHQQQFNLVLPKFNFLKPCGKSKKSRRKAIRKILLMVNDLFKEESKGSEK